MEPNKAIIRIARKLFKQKNYIIL